MCILSSLAVVTIVVLARIQVSIRLLRKCHVIILMLIVGVLAILFWLNLYLVVLHFVWIIVIWICSFVSLLLWVSEMWDLSLVFVISCSSLISNNWTTLHLIVLFLRMKLDFFVIIFFRQKWQSRHKSNWTSGVLEPIRFVIFDILFDRHVLKNDFLLTFRSLFHYESCHTKKNGTCNYKNYHCAGIFRI